MISEEIVWFLLLILFVGCIAVVTFYLAYLSLFMGKISCLIWSHLLSRPEKYPEHGTHIKMTVFAWKQYGLLVKNLSIIRGQAAQMMKTLISAIV